MNNDGNVLLKAVSGIKIIVQNNVQNFFVQTFVSEIFSYKVLSYFVIHMTIHVA